MKGIEFKTFKEDDEHIVSMVLIDSGTDHERIIVATENNLYQIIEGRLHKVILEVGNEM